MARLKKSYVKEDGKEYRVCGGGCDRELELTRLNFPSITNCHGKKYFESYCHVCKSVYMRKYREKNKRIVSPKAFRKLERQLGAIREEMAAWQPLFTFAKSLPLSSGFQTPQDFILATLKTVYDGRQKENLRS